MKSPTIALVELFRVGVTITQAGAIAREKTPADPAANMPVAARASAEKPQEFKPPPGFGTKRRGKLVRCDYLVAREENKRDMDRVRASCVNLCARGQPEAC